MKLPPLALTAPTLCPRCDQPSLLLDQCVHCALQLRHCGACRGVAGPFDRHCGFCSHELLLGPRRSFVWRLWLLAAMVPLGISLAFGLAWAGTSSPAFNKHVAASPSATPTTLLQSPTLKFQYAIPRDWVVYDYSKNSDQSQAQPLVVASRLDADNRPAFEAKGDLAGVKPQGAVLALQRRPPSPATDTPMSLLSAQVGQLVAEPPQGATIEVLRRATAVRVARQPAAEAVVKISREGSSFYMERAYIATADASRQFFRLEMLVPASEWDGGLNERAVETILQSIRML